MGYYIDFIFDNNKNLSSEIIEKKFLEAGAQKIPLEDMAKPDKFIELWHPRFLSNIEIFSNESKYLMGNWAHIRISWGTDINKFRRTLIDLIELSKKMGSKLFDGQANMIITESNVEILLAEFKKTSVNIAGLTGHIKRDDD